MKTNKMLSDFEHRLGLLKTINTTLCRSLDWHLTQTSTIIEEIYMSARELMSDYKAMLYEAKRQKKKTMGSAGSKIQKPRTPAIRDINTQQLETDEEDCPSFIRQTAFR